jgi:hypothetical protein
MIFDKKFRPENYSIYFKTYKNSNKNNDQDNENNEDNKDKEDYKNSLLTNLNQEKSNEIINSYKNFFKNEIKNTEESFIFETFRLKYERTFFIFYSSLFILNILFIRKINKNLKREIPFKLEKHIRDKFIKYRMLNKFLFFSLGIYQIAFGLLILFQFKEIKNLTNVILPSLEKNIIDIID